MKLVRDWRMRSVTIRFDASFDLRDAIGLPRLIGRLPDHLLVSLDFSDVRWVRESALVALIPALASLHGRKVRVKGLERIWAGKSALLPVAA
jgi:hypothetical protein